ncbi:MAG: hypothetical protein AB1449_14655 [Chloroflexota bacterium]
MKPARTPLLVLAALASAALACSLQEFLSTEPSPGLAGTEAAASPAAATQPGGPAQATEGPRRLELPATPTAFTVVGPNDPRAILDLANPHYFDYFDDPQDWFDYDNPQATYRVEDGHLLGIDHQPVGGAIRWSFTSMQSGNTYAEVTATNGNCIEKDAVGFSIRLDPQITPSGYALEVSCDGAWRFRILYPDRIRDLVEWTPSEAIHAGAHASNRLGIWANQRVFVIFINGVQVGDTTDENYTYVMGYFTLYVQAAMTYDLRATFDDFAFWNIPRQQ